MHPRQRAAHPTAIGPTGSRLPDVRRIVVLRGGGLGDLLLAMPAIQSLADAYPYAEVVVIGSPSHAALLSCRPGPVHTVLTLPDADGTAEPDEQTQLRLMERAAPADLAVQLHGGGAWSNPFLRRLQPRLCVGARAPDAPPLDRDVPYRVLQHDISRGLEIVGLAGAAPTALRPWVTPTEQDALESQAPLRGLPSPLLTVHPGSRDPRRRWPVEYFAEVCATAVNSLGAGIAIVGSTGERGLVDELADECRRRLPSGSRHLVRSLAGSLSMSALTGVLERSDAVLACDSGPRHLAEAVGTPTVSVYWAGNLISAGPVGRAEHRVHVSWTTSCPVCGIDCTGTQAERCEHDVSFVASVPVHEVREDVLEMLPGKKNSPGTTPGKEGDDHARMAEPAEHTTTLP